MTTKKKTSASPAPARKSLSDDNPPSFSVMGIRYTFRKGASENFQLGMFIAALLFLLLVIYVAHNLGTAALTLNTLKDAIGPKIAKLLKGRSP